jgi:putative nucleotidyltransferase with HDIG domain
MIAAKPSAPFRIDRNFDMPTVPLVLSRIIQALDDDNSTAKEMEELILHDPSLSARILKLANSALYSFRSEVKTISHAIPLLGLNLVKSLAIGISIFKSFTQGEQSEADHINNLWMHSFGVGMVAQEVWKRRGSRKEAEFAFLCGLLHDLGKVVYFRKAPVHYSFIFAQERSEKDGDISSAEREYYGISHAALGAMLAELWGFPAELCAVIRKHHSAADPKAPMAAVTSIADTTVRLAGIGFDGDRRANADMSRLQALLRMGAEEHRQLLSFAEAKRNDIEAFFRASA